VAVVEFGLILPSYGSYSFSLLIDRIELHTWVVRAAEAQGRTDSSQEP
jgi:hypothetical protein